MLEVAEHYERFGGVSPINAQNRALVRAVAGDLTARGWDVPVYLGNRNWHPFLQDTLREMGQAGIRRALAFFTSPYSSYSGCRQYLEDIARASSAVGPSSPMVHKLRGYFNHPGFIEANRENLAAALTRVPRERRTTVPVLFSAHSIPQAMADVSDYVLELREAARLVMETQSVEPGAQIPGPGTPSRQPWEIVYQSRSGRPGQPWLEPDVSDRLRALGDAGQPHVVVHPLGFISDHMEVLFDLDVEAASAAADAGMAMTRSPSVGTHPLFVSMVSELVIERLVPGSRRRALGRMAPRPDFCPDDCCVPAAAHRGRDGATALTP
jgi:ferrochelatase